MTINTTEAVAAKLGTSVRRVQQLIRELQIEPVQRIGRSAILSDTDVRRMAKRKTKRGPAKKER